MGVARTAKAEIEREFRPDRILGADSPELALRALSLAAAIGVTPPCDLILRRRDDGEIGVSTIDPATVTPAIGNA